MTLSHCHDGDKVGAHHHQNHGQHAQGGADFHFWHKVKEWLNFFSVYDVELLRVTKQNINKVDHCGVTVKDII